MSDEPHRFSNRKEVRQEILDMANEPRPKPPVPEILMPKTLSQKILEIQGMVGTVKKRGRHTQGWSYLQIEDAVLAVNKLLVSNGLLLTGSLAKNPDGSWAVSRQPHNDKGYISEVVMVWTIEDIETGQVRQYCIPGCGYDTTDKGIYKAETGSRKYAIVQIFNLPVGDNPEAEKPTREDAKAKQQQIAGEKIAEAAARGNKTAVDALSQVEPERKIKILRPEEHNGNYIHVLGLLAVPQLERFFDDTNSKRYKRKVDGVPYWRIASEYEKGFVILCQKLGIEVEG